MFWVDILEVNNLVSDTLGRIPKEFTTQLTRTVRNTYYVSHCPNSSFYIFFIIHDTWNSCWRKESDSSFEDYFSVNTGPTASIEGPSPSLVTEGSSLPICVVLNMPPTSTATVFISTQDRPSQTALGEYKHKICVVHSNKCNLI